MLLHTALLETPTGTIILASGTNGLCSLCWEPEWRATRQALERRFQGARFKEDDHQEHILACLQAYFQGDLHALEALVVDPGGTAFQQQVWHALRQIPAGATWSYSQQAAFIGQPLAARAVGQANGRNPIPIVIPCHRVVAANGGLGGFSSGLHHKRWLLRHEGILLATEAGK